jgi:dolichol kinase
MSSVTNVLILAAAFGLLFAVAEMLHRKGNVPAETTRKIVHLVTGILTLLFPLLLDTIAEAGLLCGLFLLILILSMRHGMLPSINAIDRKSWGSLLYPVIVFGIFAFYKSYAATENRLFHPLYYYYTPILVMAVCDPVAALAGSAFRNRYPHTPPGKTMAGSFAFFFSAAILIACLAAYFCQNALPFEAYLVTSIMLAFMATLAERFSNYGWDNFTIPVAIALGMHFMEMALKGFPG